MATIILLTLIIFFVEREILPAVPTKNGTKSTHAVESIDNRNERSISIKFSVLINVNEVTFCVVNKRKYEINAANYSYV